MIQSIRMEIICDIGIGCIAVGIVHIAVGDIAGHIAAVEGIGRIAVAGGTGRIAAAEGIVHMAADMADGKDFAVDGSYSVVTVGFV
jgi:hypothetical protein